MVTHIKNKVLLFIEPLISQQQDQVKGYGTIIISTHDFSLIPLKIEDPFSFFQIDTENEEAVLNLVSQIAKNFTIEQVIPGSQPYEALAEKISLLSRDEK